MHLSQREVDYVTDLIDALYLDKEHANNITEIKRSVMGYCLFALNRTLDLSTIITQQKTILLTPITIISQYMTRIIRFLVASCSRALQPHGS